MGRIVDLLALISNGAGLISLGVTLVLAFFAVKSGKLQSANTAQGSAISALQAEMEVLRRKDEDKTKENEQLNTKIVRLEQTIETICAALQKRGLLITIQGEMVNIADRHGNSTTARIRRTAAGGQGNTP